MGKGSVYLNEVSEKASGAGGACVEKSGGCTRRDKARFPINRDRAEIKCRSRGREEEGFVAK